jgi:hypothetical protein
MAHVLLSGVPTWVLALVAAAVAPSCVRLFASSLERRVQRRTVDTVAQVIQRSSPVGAHTSAGEETKEAKG